MSDLTARQQQILEVVDEHLAHHGYPPTVREIGEAVGLTSSSTVHAHLANLERLGHLRRDPTKPRALGLVGRDSAAPEPVARVAERAGHPHAAAARPDRRRRADARRAARRGGDRGARDAHGVGRELPAQVRGESMIDAGILDGDFVVIRRQSSCADGEIVAALVDGEEATVKHLRHEGARVRLDPANAGAAPVLPRAGRGARQGGRGVPKTVMGGVL